MDLPMCNFRSIPWYCRYVVIGHNSNFGKDLIFTIVMTQTHFKTRSTRLPTEMMTLRRLSWSQIYVFIRKRVISLDEKENSNKVDLLMDFVITVFGQVLFDVNHDQVNFLRDVLLWQDQIYHTGDDRHIVVENSNFLWIRFNGKKPFEKQNSFLTFFDC